MRDRVAKTAALKESRRLRQRIEAGLRGPGVSLLPDDFERHRAVERPHRKLYVATNVHDRELRRMMLAGKHPATGQAVEERTGVAARNKYALPLNASRLCPFHRDPVGSVLARQAERTGQADRPNLFQPDKADAGHGLSAMEL